MRPCTEPEIAYNTDAPPGAFSKLMILVTYLRSAVEELRHVTWPTRSQAVRLSSIVLGFTVVSALAYGFIDLLLGQLMALLLSLA